MPDPFIPSFSPGNVAIPISISLSPTNTQTASQGFTFNEAGKTFNEAGMQFGGLYQINQDITPTFFNEAALQFPISFTLTSTQAQVEDQGYAFNQAGFSFNQAGVMFGGLYNIHQDISPAFFNDTALFVTPYISGIVDIGGAVQPSGNAGRLMGILGLTYAA